MVETISTCIISSSCFALVGNVFRFNIQHGLPKLQECLLAVIAWTNKDWLNLIQIKQSSYSLAPNTTNIVCRIALRPPFNPVSHTPWGLLHWLPIKSRINFKYTVLTNQPLYTGHPAYLRKYLKPFISNQVLNRQDSATLCLCTWLYKGSTARARSTRTVLT